MTSGSGPSVRKTCSGLPAAFLGFGGIPTRQRIRDVVLRPVLEDVGVKVVDVSILVTEKIFFSKKHSNIFFTSW